MSFFPSQQKTSISKSWPVSNTQLVISRTLKEGKSYTDWGGVEDEKQWQAWDSCLDGPKVKVGFPGGTIGKESACQRRRCERLRFNPWVRKIPWREGMATHSSILAWRIPWTEELGGLLSMGSQRAGHDWVTKQQPKSNQCDNFCVSLPLVGKQKVLINQIIVLGKEGFCAAGLSRSLGTESNSDWM